MSARSLDEFNHERQALDQAHAQNEAGRDAFIALAHTALFAASVSFVGDIAPLAEAIWRPALIATWTADVIGLLALTLSFGAARRAVDARRAALNDPVAPQSRLAEALNGIALWSFPLALLCLFSFVTANVVNADDREAHPTATSSELRQTRSNSAPEGAESRRSPEAVDRGNPGSANSTSAASTASAEKVNAGQ